jgi:hypothetical protein
MEDRIALACSYRGYDSAGEGKHATLLIKLRLKTDRNLNAPMLNLGNAMKDSSFYLRKIRKRLGWHKLADQLGKRKYGESYTAGHDKFDRMIEAVRPASGSGRKDRCPNQLAPKVAPVDFGNGEKEGKWLINLLDSMVPGGGRTPTTLRSADFEPSVSSLYAQVPSYSALYNGKSTTMKRPTPRDMPSYTALLPALRRKQPLPKPLEPWVRQREAGQLSACKSRKTRT